MAYAQQAALRTQETFIRLTSSVWTALESSSTWNGTDAAGNTTTSAISNRFAVKVMNIGTGGATRVLLSYNSSASIKNPSHVLGAGQFVVEPASTGLTLYGRAKLASGVNTVRVIVTEYGY